MLAQVKFVKTLTLARLPSSHLLAVSAVLLYYDRTNQHPSGHAPFTPAQLAWLQGIFASNEHPELAQLPSPTNTDLGISATWLRSDHHHRSLDTGSAANLYALNTRARPLAAATTATNPHPLTLAILPPISAAGPYNPEACLSPKVVKMILDLNFVEMSEISISDETPQAPGRPLITHPPPPPPVQDISQWMECFSLMVAVVTRFPEKVPKLWAYQATIILAERKYEGKWWVTYDRQYRRRSLARKNLNWSVTDPRLYKNSPGEHSPSQNTIRQSTAHTTQTAHTSRWFPDPVAWLAYLPPSHPQQIRPPAQVQEICRHFNEGRCKYQKCKYRHVCSTCQGAHTAIDCPGPRNREKQLPAMTSVRGTMSQLAPRY